jgi:hypothetical protein
MAVFPRRSATHAFIASIIAALSPVPPILSGADQAGFPRVSRRCSRCFLQPNNSHCVILVRSPLALSRTSMRHEHYGDFSVADSAARVRAAVAAFTLAPGQLAHRAHKTRVSCMDLSPDARSKAAWTVIPGRGLHPRARNPMNTGLGKKVDGRCSWVRARPTGRPGMRILNLEMTRFSPLLFIAKG